MSLISTFRRPRRLLAVGAVIAVFGLAACGSDDDEPALDTTPDVTVTEADDSTGGEAAPGEGVVVAEDFSLTDVEVAPGAQLTLDNQGNATHTLTADDGAFDTGDIDGGSKSDPVAAPDAPGSYPYHCEIHPDSMTGVLTVAG